ncbi:hypothetical protein AKO1_004329 [Acrasis kona]|uniref:Uncharacterized protein n=1 Tax=Acrasis kona TaxID=1008807 RepID=A0AAW2YNE7_9EUKA
MAQELAQQDLYDDDDDDDDEEDEDLEDDLDTQVEQLKQLSMDAELDKDDTDSVSEWESDSDHESDQDDEDEDNRKDDDDEDDEEEDDDAPPRHKPSSSKNKLTPQQRQQQRIIRRNYIFAFMNRRVRHNDPVASKLVRYETQQYENAQIKLDTELQALTDAIERSKNDYKQLKDQVKKNDSENKKLRRDYKMLKMLRNITLPHKKIRHENKINQSKLTREHRECNQWNDAYQQVDKVLRAETDKLINQFRTRRQKDVQFEKSLNDYIKDQFKIFTIAKEQRESKRVEFKIPLSQQQPFAASSLLRASPEEALRVFGLNHSSPGAPTSPNTLAQRLVILKHYRCLYHFVDGFLCLLEEPNQYITFVPFTDMRQLVMIGGGRSIHELPKLTLKLDEVNSVSKCDLGRRNQSGIEILDRSGRNHQFHGLDDRDDAYEAVDQFLCERSREFEERRRQQGNVLVQAVRGVFGSHNQHHQQHSTSTSQDSRKVIPRDSNDDKGYPVSDALRKKFTILLHNERLMDQFFCKESAQKLPGNLYLFTDSLCFGASVSIGLSSGKYMYPFDKLSKMSKVQKNGIKVTDKQGRTITYSGIKERDDAFQKICSVIERSKSGALNVLYKQQGNIAVITAHVEQGSQSQEQVMPNISKYAKYLKLDFK